MKNARSLGFQAAGVIVFDLYCTATTSPDCTLAGDAASGCDDGGAGVGVETVLLGALAVGNGEGELVTAGELLALGLLGAIGLHELAHLAAGLAVLVRKAAGKRRVQERLNGQVSTVPHFDLFFEVGVERGDAHREDDEVLLTEV